MLLSFFVEPNVTHIMTLGAITVKACEVQTHVRGW